MTKHIDAKPISPILKVYEKPVLIDLDVTGETKGTKGTTFPVETGTGNPS